MQKNSIFCLLILISLRLGAAEIPHFSFTPADISKHLTQKTVRQIYQDHTGYIWLATQEGLNRYDAYQLINFTHDPGQVDSISSDNVRAVVEDRQQRLWIATSGGGLNLFHPARQTFTAWQADKPSSTAPLSNYIQSLHLDQDGKLWIGYKEGNFSQFDPDLQHFTHFTLQDLLPEAQAGKAITSIQDDDHAIWLATDGNGLLRLDKKTLQLAQFNTASTSLKLTSNRLKALFIDQQQRLWLASYDAGLAMLGPQRRQLESWQHQDDVANSLPTNLVHQIYQDKQDRLWIASDAGVSIWDGADHFYNFANDDSFHHNKVLSIYQDLSGLFWLGTFNGLINGVEVPFEHLDHGLASNVIMGFAETVTESGHKAVWVASYGGLTQLDEQGQVQQVLNKQSQPALADARVMTAKGNGKHLWFGMRAGGLGRLNVQTNHIDYFTHDPDNPDSLSFNGVTSIYVDNNQNLWVGTYGGGLNYLKEGSHKFTHYRMDPDNARSLNSDKVLAVYQLHSGELIVGTEKGINRFTPASKDFERIEHIPDNANSLSAPMAWAFYQDKQQRVWIGTQGGGLNQWQPDDIRQHNNKFKRYGNFSGLPSSHIYSIQGDDNGYLWLSSNKGLTRLDPQTGSMRHFDTYQGLKDSEFNFGAGFRDSQGYLYFGGNSGVVRFDPDQVKDNKIVPPVVLIRIKKLNEPVWFDVPYQQLSQLELNYKDYLLSFEFAALDFHAPELNQYRYKLEGLDSNWIELEHRRLATFTNLPAGDYVLRAQASNNQGIWNEQGVSLPIRVLPPPWKTMWAYSLYTLAAALIVLNVIWRYRKKRQQEMRHLIELEEKVEERTKELVYANEQLEISMLETDKARVAAEQASQEKSNFLAIMSHEIRTPMNGVLGMTEVLLGSGLKPKQKHFAQLAHRSGRLLLDLLNNILDYSKLEAGKATLESMPVDLQELVEEVCDLFSEAAHNKNLHINPILSPDVHRYVMADPARLRQILANLVSNAIKFTETGEINLQLEYCPADTRSGDAEQMLRFRVQDTGIGMPANRQQKVFDMFTQADVSTTRKYGGTGLGLAICQQLTTLMSGQLKVKSTLGQGSEFILDITFPLTQHTDTPLPPLPSSLVVYLVNLQGGLARSIESMLQRLNIKLFHVQRIKPEVASAQDVLWMSLPSGQQAIIDAEIDLNRWICLLPSSQWQEEDTRNVLTLPAHYQGLQNCLYQALGLPVAAAATTDSVHHQYKGAKILVAEDSLTNQEVAKNMLMSLGCEVWLADNGKEAVEQITAHRPDLVLMDCQMPVMDGYAASRNIRKQWPDLPIVALTAGMGENLKQQCLDAGMNAVMSKPFSMQELAHTLYQYLPCQQQATSAAPATTPLAGKSADKLLDMATIETLQTISQETGNPVFARVLDAFNREASILSEQMISSAAHNPPNYDELAEQAHALKSMSGNTGAKVLYKLCQDMELAAKNENPEKCRLLVEKIKMTFKNSLDSLETFRYDS